MFVVICRAKVKPDKVALYEATFRALREKVLANEPGISFYELCRLPAEPGTYRVVEAYADQAAQERHLGMDYYLEAGPTIVECLVDGAFEMEVTETI
jgi:quinol monooxygenase YgiN